ncbi:MAG: hypothetical protein A2992_00565 [Elusimicrobia bacterium RIFCSPLOWO2_01_FULL_59_12]|nr:MAG: hypothetical protein A2992_00565 [Elusimicrobia bacterium RIFCSPLOWO2_01_FULL_59_12]
MLFLSGAIGLALAGSKPAPFLSPFKIRLSSEWGEITQFFIPASPSSRKRPDFILIQDIHSNQSAQFAISQLLKQIQNQGLLPGRIAVEGAVGPVPLQALQQLNNPKTRMKAANHLVSRGKITGAAHFVIAEGKGELIGVESDVLHKTSVEMFRRSYAARHGLNQELDKLNAALSLLKTDSVIPAPVSLLSQDSRVIRHLINHQLVPSETHEAINRAVLAVDHLKRVLPQTSDYLLEAVSAAVNFYALALLRDEALLAGSLDLRRRDAQRTTVIVAGGFHTPGLVQRLNEQGYSYVVITPRIERQTRAGERLYVSRVLGQSLTAEPAFEPALNARVKNAEIWTLAARLHQKIGRLQFSTSPGDDIFAAMDLPWIQPSIRLALTEQRLRIFAPALTAANDLQESWVF